MASQARVAAITGASSGIGEATARVLASEGFAVALAARREDRLKELAESIESDGGRAAVFACDVTDEAQAREFVSGANEQLGGLDVLVNNAGVMLLGPVMDADLDDARPPSAELHHQLGVHHRAYRLDVDLAEDALIEQLEGAVDVAHRHVEEHPHQQVPGVGEKPS